MSDDPPPPAQKPIPDYSGMSVEEAMALDPDFSIRCCIEGNVCDPQAVASCEDPNNNLQKQISGNHEDNPPGMMAPDLPYIVGVYIINPS